MRSDAVAWSLGLALTSVLLSCELLPTTVQVQVRLPATPETWEAAWGPAGFTLSWQAAGDGGESPAIHGAGQMVALELPRTPPVTLRAVPTWSGQDASWGPSLATGEALATAGALWPLGMERCAPGSPDEVLPLRFETGSAAEIVRRLLDAGTDLRKFNLQRLVVEIEERLPDDPWSVDVDRIVAAIGSRAMRVSYIRTPTLHEIGLVAPDGIWVATSPFVAPIPGGATWLPLPVGVSRFYSVNGERWVVEVDQAGRAWQPSWPEAADP